MDPKDTSAIASRREIYGWYFYDWACSAFSTTVVTVFLGPYLTEIARSAAGPDGYLNILGISVYAPSYFAYIISISVLMQIIFLPVAGAIADYTNKKKFILGLFAYIGAFATMGMYFLEGERYILGAMLFIIANLAFGISIVVYNAFLNEIAEPHLRDDISSKGWATGYIGGGILLLLNLLLFSNAEDYGISTGMAVRISLASAGIWWALFTVFPMITLKLRKPIKEIPPRTTLFSIGFRQLFTTLKGLKKYPKTLVFLIAYLLYNDGVQAVIALSAQFGSEELGLDMTTLTQIILLVQFVAFAGALIFNYIAKATGTKNAILISLVIWAGAVIYAFAWLRGEFDFYILGAVIGFVLGGTQALSRSLFSLLIPYGKEAEYFSLYEISERGTSWMGTVIFGLSLQFTGSYRIAILSLVIFFISGFIMLASLNVKAAIKDVAATNP